MGTDFHSAVLANAAGEKLFSWEPPCEELDPATLAINDTDGNAVRYQLVFVQKITFVLRKINKNCCHQS